MQVKSASTSALVVRIVVCGSTYRQNQLDNRDDARAMLLEAFASKQWPSGRAFVAITPGGFVRIRLPHDYDGARGWDTKKRDLRKLIPYVESAIEGVLRGKVLKKARKRTRFITLGVDLNVDRQKEERIRRNHYCRPSCPPEHTHAELVAVIETASGKFVRWTGKSYPVDEQQHTLIHVRDLRSHLVEIGRERLLVLGCHDLNLLINRGRKSKSGLTPKQARRRRMQALVREFRPTMILHHPHSTYSPRVWSAARGAAQAMLRTACISASGIAFYGNPKPKQEWRSWQTLDATLSATASGDGIVDVVIKGRR